MRACHPPVLRPAAVLLLLLALPAAAAAPGTDPGTAPPAAADTSSHYRIDAEIRPESGRFDVSVEMRFAPRSATDTLRFLLHDDLEIRGLESAAVEGYSEQPWQLRGVDSLHTRVVTLPLTRTATPSEPVELSWRYEGRLRNDRLPPIGAPAVTPHWVELPVEAMWVPIHASLSERFTFEATVDLPEGFRVVAPGSLEETSAGWRIRSSVPGPDVPLVISDRMRVREHADGAVPVSVHHAGAPDSVIDFVSRSAGQILDRYDAWFRTGTESDALRITLPPVERGRGASYARTGFIALSHGAEADPGLFRLLAHEAAHLWWTDAESPLSRHNFLNESFAEYAAWRSVREEYGEEAFREQLEEARKKAKGAPGFDEWTPRNDGVLSYHRGPVLLHRLHRRIGEEEFTAFLRALQRRSVGTLEGMVATLEEVAGAETAEWFEEML